MTDVARSLLPPPARRSSWRVSALEVGPDGLLAPAGLVAHAIEVASALTEGEAASVAVHDLKVVGTVQAGATLDVTAALERVDAHLSVVSVVVRSGTAAGRGGVVALGTLRVHRGAPSEPVSPPSGGLTPIEAHFRADRREALEGAVGRWLQDTALVSAQSFAAGPVTFEAVAALSIFRAPHLGQALWLHSSVVEAHASRVSVLTQVRDEVSGDGVLCAVTAWRPARPLGASRWIRRR